MYTPLDIENKKFAKQMMNGYSVEEVDEFLDELTLDYEKLYKQSNENNTKIAYISSLPVIIRKEHTHFEKSLNIA